LRQFDINYTPGQESGFYFGKAVLPSLNLILPKVKNWFVSLELTFDWRLFAMSTQIKLSFSDITGNVTAQINANEDGQIAPYFTQFKY
jgi:hypothetical protein